MAYLRSFWARLYALLFSVLGATTTSGAAPQDADIEASAWQRAVEENTSAAYEMYLRDHPVGSHVREALEQIVELSASSLAGATSSENADEPLLLAAEDDSWSKDADEDRDRGVGLY